MKMKITEVTECDSKAPTKPAKSYTICLNMIVKNESHIIEQTLENLCKYVDFDAYYISDTGSTDNTMDLIRTFFKARGIPGTIEQVEWRDFGFNRTLALQMAFQKTDYLFIFDADDSIHGNFVLPHELTHDAYQLKLGQSFVYLRTLIVNNRKRWRFVGVLHEYITCVDKEDSSHAIQGDYHVDSGRSGSRNKDPQKYIKDATVLERGYHEEMTGTGDRGLAERYAFYCAQSWMDAGPAHIDSSIQWYERVLTQNNWSQEKYYSALCLGNLYYKKGDKYNAFKYYSKTIEYDEERIEGVASMMEFLRADGNHVIVNALYQKFKNYNRSPQNKLFLATDKYNDVIEYNNSISAFYIADKRNGYDCCKMILQHNIMAFHFMKSTYSNLAFYRQYFEEDTFPELLRLFFSVNRVLSIVASKSDEYSDDDFETWTRLFNKVRPALVAPTSLQKTEEEYLPGSSAETIRPEDELSYKKPVITKFHLKRSHEYGTTAGTTASPVIVKRNRTAHARIIITFTTCKRLDLFQQTMNSILNMWNDVNMIDYWYCVDDNSSESDRAHMKKTYPWIDFYMKDATEKGHRTSMNIIWDKLTESRPEYWIHMEDDFLFHTPDSYVGKATQMMVDSRNAGYNVRQILYNRNYGETIKDYKMLGHRILRNMTHDVALHQHKTGDFAYGNCHYWPHYSFRPSMIDVNAILILGNYDSANQFFEMDYAKRWQSLGFLSGFYNQITNRHIGRLTSERDDKSQPNAYELNDENQFVAKMAADAAVSPATKPIAASIPVASVLDVAAPKKRYYSTIPFDDGFGAQFQRFIWTCIYAEECEQSTFVYRSPKKMAHNYDDDNEFIEKMDTIMNLKPHYMSYNDALVSAREEGIQILTPDFYDIFNYVERNIDICMKSESMARIKRRFWENKNRAAVYAGFSVHTGGEYTLHLAAHIRRPNCDDTRPNGGEEYTDKYYIKTLLTIRDKYAKSKPVDRIMIHIYSQGAADKFAHFIGNDIIGKDVVLHLNDTIEQTYLGMAAADILITSASSFSYSAAFFSDGDIYYTQFWHKPCSWWNILEKV